MLNTNTAAALRTFARRMGYTHAAPPVGSFALLYSTETCEACGCAVQGANAVNVLATQADIAGTGLTVADAPEEGGWSDDFGGVTCGCK